MRIDKFLKVSRVIKRRSVAADACDGGRIEINGKVVKPSKDVKIGDVVTVVKLHGEGAVRRRIMDMGITKNVEIFIRKVAPLGDPIEINVRGYELSLRKSDAEMIEIR